MSHTKPPYRADGNYVYATGPGRLPQMIARCPDIDGTPFLENAAFLALACNAHAALLEACKAQRAALEALRHFLNEGQCTITLSVIAQCQTAAMAYKAAIAQAEEC